MGMYDNVDFEMDCPICGQKITGFQTKSCERILITVEIEDLPGKANFYSSCDSCGLRVEFKKNNKAFRERKRELKGFWDSCKKDDL